MRVLICDDNIAIRESLSAYLCKEGIQSDTVGDGESALYKMNCVDYNLLVLDIMLPGIDGMEVCKRIRQKSEIPILMLSAKGGESVRIQGLELGADDYVEKPFSPREVAVRIRNILKRSNGIDGSSKIYTAAELEVDMSAYEVRINGQRYEFTGKEIEVLYYFLRHVETLVSREQILNAVWGFDYDGDVRAVDTQIKRIRKKISGMKLHFRITSIYGKGYKFEVDE